MPDASASGRVGSGPGVAPGSTRPTQPAVGGFTLIEALVAIVILALALSALLSAHDTGLRGVTVVDEHLEARLLAQSLLAQWSQYRVLQAPSQGRSGRYAWTVSAVPYRGPDALPRQTTGDWTLHELAVTVAWPSGKQVRLSTLRLLHAP
ncbi:MAG: prepilin-type N-terminal cleavage/methylation domain-containing protein [Hyphomicrobiaceae bacterium]|nr:prepilin-type N-terminal cleavage/methylation domain-containing protein [Hyphomicrobiaceae bacterium]